MQRVRFVSLVGHGESRVRRTAISLTGSYCSLLLATLRGSCTVLHARMQGLTIFSRFHVLRVFFALVPLG